MGDEPRLDSLEYPTRSMQRDVFDNKQLRPHISYASMQDPLIYSPIGSVRHVQEAHPNHPINYTTTVQEQVIFTPPSSIKNGATHLGHRNNGVVIPGSQLDPRFLPQPPLGPRKTKARSSIRRAAKILLNKSKQALSGSDSHISSLGPTGSRITGRNDRDSGSAKPRHSRNQARMGDLLNGHRYTGNGPMGKENMRVVSDDSSISDRSGRLGHFGGDMTRRFHSAENVSASSVFSSDSSHHSGSEATHDDLSSDGARISSGGYALRRYNSGPIQRGSGYNHHRGYHTADSDSTDSSHRSDSHYIMAGQNRIGSGRRTKTTREALRKLNRNCHSFDGPQHNHQRNGTGARPTGPLKADHNIQPFNFNERLNETTFSAPWKEQGARPKYSSTESLETTESVSHEILPDTAIRSDSEDARGSRRHPGGASPSRSVRFEDEDVAAGDPLRRTLSAPLSSRRRRGETNGQDHSRDTLGGDLIPENPGGRQLGLGQGNYDIQNGHIPNRESHQQTQKGEQDSDDFDSRHYDSRVSPQARQQRIGRDRQGRDVVDEQEHGSHRTLDSGLTDDSGFEHRTSSTDSPPSSRAGRYRVQPENGKDSNNEFRHSEGGLALEVSGSSPISERLDDPVENGMTPTPQVLDDTLKSDQFVRGTLVPVFDEVKRAKKTYSTHAISYQDAIQAHSAWDDYKKRLQEESSSLSYDPEHYSKMSGSNLSIASNSSISEKVQHLGEATKQKLGRMRRALSLDRLNRSPPSDGVAKSPLKRSPSLRSLSSFLGKKKDKLMGSFTDLSSSQRRSSTIGGFSMAADIEPVGVTTPSYMRKIGRVLELGEDGTQLVRLVKPPNGPFGFYIAKGASPNGPGIFVKRIGDGHPAKILAGLLQVGDEILEINGQCVKEEKCIDRVYDLILDNDDLVLKTRPLVRRGDEIS